MRFSLLGVKDTLVSKLKTPKSILHCLLLLLFVYSYTILPGRKMWPLVYTYQYLAVIIFIGQALAWICDDSLSNWGKSLILILQHYSRLDGSISFVHYLPHRLVFTGFFERTVLLSVCIVMRSLCTIYALHWVHCILLTVYIVMCSLGALYSAHGVHCDVFAGYIVFCSLCTL